MKIPFPVITFFPALALFPACSCSTEAAVQQILGSSAQSPVFYGCRAEADETVSFSFSAPVKFESAYFDPPVEFEAEAEGETVKFRFASGLPGGSKITADVLVEDSRGNTLNVLVPFRTRNTEVPRLLVSEIRTENANTSEKSSGPLRTEFVELFAQTGGNLGALRLFAAGSGKGKGGSQTPIWEFPPVKVKAGEYVLIHTRTHAKHQDYADETGGDLALSKGPESVDGARDFWIPGNEARIHNTDAVFILDQDDRIVDGVLLCEKEEAWKGEIVNSAELFETQDSWKPDSGASSAVPTADATATRTVNRRPDGKGSFLDAKSAADWYIPSKNGMDSPGRPNQ